MLFYAGWSGKVSDGAILNPVFADRGSHGCTRGRVFQRERQRGKRAQGGGGRGVGAERALGCGAGDMVCRVGASDLVENEGRTPRVTGEVGGDIDGVVSRKWRGQLQEGGRTASKYQQQAERDDGREMTPGFGTTHAPFG